MKKCIILILLTSVFVNAQNQNIFIEVKVSIQKQKLEEVQVTKNERKYRGKNTLIFECDTKKQLVFSDNYNDENYVKYEELGDIKNSIIVIHKIEYNSEQYILVETKSCKQLTLDGFPLKVENTEKYIVLNNPGTDEEYKIQILEFKNDFFEVKNTIVLTKEIIPKQILRVEKKELYLLDTENRIWKTNLE